MDYVFHISGISSELNNGAIVDKFEQSLSESNASTSVKRSRNNDEETLCSRKKLATSKYADALGMQLAVLVCIYSLTSA
jgi:hypothetical protein